MVCREWVHASHKRLVKLRLGPEPALHVTDRKGDKLRTLPLDHTDQLTVLESQVKLYFILWILPYPTKFLQEKLCSNICTDMQLLKKKLQIHFFSFHNII